MTQRSDQVSAPGADISEDTSERARPGAPDHTPDGKGEFRRSIGYILGVSYPLLAISTCGRAVYQFFVEGAAEGDAPILSLTAAALYLTASIGFFVRKPWAWWLSVSILFVETAFTLVIGTTSLVAPDLIGRNAWTGFGVDYAFFPLFQPLLGLFWLLWSDTRRAYGIVDDSLEERAALGA